MEDQNHFSSAKKLLDSANSIIIILPPDPSVDLVSAGLSLHLSLKSSGKKSQIGCGSEVHVASNLQGAHEIADSIGARNLVISFNYHENDLEKVDYDVRPDGKFYLMIKPKANSPIPDVSNVKYSYSGASADLVISLGIGSLEELGKIYADEKKFLDEAQILSLHTSPKPVQFTKNLLHQTTGSYSELVSVLLEKVGIKPSSEAGKNLLGSIYEETKNLTSPRMTAETFSAIAFLMRHGARLPNQPAFVPRFAQPAFFEAPSTPEEDDVTDEDLPPDQEEIPLPQEDYSLKDSQGSLSTDPVPQDWTKPKIFRATDL
ncbi:hypothetical protein A3K29_01480 [Candidatus Collierbacteria bacterium RIFOXYB2_FULL_46_14]|uniref:Exopolyphosphatase-related protein n=1 Tax=Candidatus Collierbacteria bacterium GW2011_GWA2_46_26 TaxID=1618381 RepID=A0A0G1PJF5_9BACT|nr:MAG: hypothetical protein UW29_C0006G0035 [Candidatus Collierbacteria bacterium GW2011_GWC2_44_13]KKU32822.1 MAG: hypothetical protein UX47_C0007G0066 [Candidatus Collierbacteria bacterium GW2011_GWA2_46_26]OGD72801.1 MAG: hypothetical protein A3K29_01480 [Candidatus Collierbacteria bacterium RIFOXYB2_FULL_46_14]OGD75843.1 MAG: hypothetical protein A3K43_01480 [Candidatus Collierbacteria bacterium RIFOXYA2_FULL_46_20]OGD77179.1 MAG: hypothetical protein A3K39_01480 [Candidatus Collierbacteri